MRKRSTSVDAPRVLLSPCPTLTFPCAVIVFLVNRAKAWHRPQYVRASRALGMAISDKARKILWGRSGNRCAMCRRELVVAATSADDDSVVGDECHIVSAAGQGPRHDPAFPENCLDEPANLILLCRVHHKMVDDQHETYTAEVLRTMKANHERWVASTLTEGKVIAPVRVRRLKENIPSHFVRLTSGRDLFAVVDGASGYAFQHDEPASEAEAQLLASFLQEMQDYGELSSDLEAGDRVQAAFRLSALLENIEQAGFWVFGGGEVRRLEGGGTAPSPFPVAILQVLRKDNPEILRVDLRSAPGQDPEVVRHTVQR